MKLRLHLFILTVLVAAACGSGSGEAVSERRDVGRFLGLNVSGGFSVEVTVGKEQSVIVESDPKVQNAINTKVEDGILFVRSDRTIDGSKPKIRITIAGLRSLEVSGASDVSVKGVDEKELRLRSGGTSTISISGKASIVDASTAGTAQIEAGKLSTNSAKVQANGASLIDLDVRWELDAEANGSSQILYSGKPSTVKQTTAGTGNIRPKIIFDSR